MAHPKLTDKALPPMVIMGVSGSGKSTIGSLLSSSLGLLYVDGDRLHTDENRAKMSSGAPLDDRDRGPWLRRVGELLAQSEREEAGVIVACSALKRSYRSTLNGYAGQTVYIHLDGSRELIAARLSQREHAYMPPELLNSQLQALEELETEERSIVVNIDQTPEEIVIDIELQLVTLLDQQDLPAKLD